MTYAISAAGLALVQEFEGFRADPGLLPDGSWVVGFAHVRVGEPGAPVSRNKAAHVLALDLAPVERLVNAHVTTTLTQSQFDALVSFAFSVGAEAFVQSQVLRRVNTGEVVAAACAMDAWRKSDVSGELEIVDALVRRRAAEKALFLKELPHDAAPSVFMRAKLDHAAAILGAPIKYASAPAVSAEPVAAPVAQAAQSFGQRLTEILKSEPATEALLLTHVAPQAEIDAEDEIITAHARPVARRIEPFTPPLPRDRRVSRLRQGAPSFGPRFKLPTFKSAPSIENVGLIALMALGLGLTYLAGSMLFARDADTVSIAGAAALALPGLAATLLAAYGMLRPAPVRSAALVRPYAAAA